jgi:hypothetical protein
VQDVEAYAFFGQMSLEEGVCSADFATCPFLRLEYLVSAVFAFARGWVSDDSGVYD